MNIGLRPRALFLCLILLAGASSSALGEPPEALYGGEWEFKGRRHYVDGIRYLLNEPIFYGADETSYNVYARQWRERHENICRSGRCSVETITESPLKYRVKYPNGFWFEVKWDLNTVEVATKPTSKREYESMRKILQRDVWDSASTVGLHAPPVGGVISAGHISIDLKAFNDDPKLLLDFILDYTKHSELANGILNLDYDNAKPLQAQPELMNHLLGLREQIAKNRISNVEEFVELLWKDLIQKDGKHKGMALSITKGRLEIRALRAQRSFDEFLKLVKLFDARREYLKNNPSLDIEIASPISDVKQSVENFYRYVTESGLDWADYAGLMPPQYQIYEMADDGQAYKIGLLPRCLKRLASVPFKVIERPIVRARPPSGFTSR